MAVNSRTSLTEVSQAVQDRRLPNEQRRKTILLVEDEASVRQYTAIALERIGYRVLKSPSAKHALELVAREEPEIDLLLTDLLLPEMDGRELAKALGARFPGMSVLYLSGYTAAAAVREGVLEVGSAFLQKPFELAALAKKVRELLNQE